MFSVSEFTVWGKDFLHLMQCFNSVSNIKNVFIANILKADEFSSLACEQHVAL